MPRLLIVDDDIDLLTVVESLLHKRGFTISGYTDWNNAWETVKSYDPQLILLDIFLKGIDGLEICKRLKSSTFTRHIPVIIFSSSSHMAETAIHEFGADDFIAKPFEVNDLVKKIHKVLSKNIKQHKDSLKA